MFEVVISNGKVYITDPNDLQKYVQDCINNAAERLKDNLIVEGDILEYVIKKITGYDEPHDPEWQPVARFAMDNLADTQTALNFIGKYYNEFQETVDYMAENTGKGDFYKAVFYNNFDLVKLVVTVYSEITYEIGRITEILE